MRDVLKEIREPTDGESERLDSLNLQLAGWLLKNTVGERLRLGLEVCRAVAEYAVQDKDD